jgi:hypothetical protein
VSQAIHQSCHLQVLVPVAVVVEGIVCIDTVADGLLLPLRLTDANGTVEITVLAHDSDGGHHCVTQCSRSHRVADFGKPRGRSRSDVKRARGPR